ncbi:MAG: DUF4982 domain-containing protein [Bacteroides sp.]|nr:DUF4982 domain-containing protein [Bacteroides sp.]
MKTIKRMIAMWLCMVCCLSIEAAQVERKQLFNDGWKFWLGDEATASTVDFDDASWRKLTLPHDWSIEHDFDVKYPSGNDGGYVMTGVGWYRKSFLVPSNMVGKRLSLYFEGVYMNSEVFVNGQSIGKRPYGYSSFAYDITPYIKVGEQNVVAVRVDNSKQRNCRWYTGAGIYRHVWLVTTEALHVAHWGTYITTPEVTKELAKVQVAVQVKNETEADKQAMVSVCLQKEDKEVAKGSLPISVASLKEKKAILSLDVKNPELWSPDTPSLYEALVTVEADGQVMDRVSEAFGIRTFTYSATDGFRLNGQSMLLNGGCAHHDNGVLGAKSFDAAEARKVRLMKEAGFNAVRTSHNLPSEAFLYECDRQGLLVIDESFDGWRDSKTPYDYSTEFDQWWQQDVDAMVLRDRNHPSIFCWSIGNEVIERKKLEVVTTAKKLADRIRLNDNTRPITSALAAWDADWEIYDPLAAQHDIVGYNYMIHKSESDHERVPERVMMQTESYPRDAFSNWTKVNDYPYIIGDFVWTSLDYLGEAGIGRFYYKGESEGEHYHRPQYPWHGAYCGDIDITGWRKPISHYRDLLYNADKKLHLAVKEPNGYYGEIKETQWSVWPTWESWNWPGHEGKTIEVEIYSRYPRVQLFLNGNLMGEQETSREQQFKAVYALNYEEGTLRAVGLDEAGNVQEERILSTAGKPAKIRLTADKRQMKADGQDLIYVIAEVLDKEGRVMPIADNRLQFSIKGAGVIEATGSADLKDSESYSKASRKAWKGRAVAVVRSIGKTGKITLNVSSPGLTSTAIVLTAKK